MALPSGILLSIISVIALLFSLSLFPDESFCHARVYRVKSNISHKLLRTRTCKVHANPKLHAIMDRVCQHCHEMFSYAMPNFRAECSQRCYKNSKFRGCLNMFSVLAPNNPSVNRVLLRMDSSNEENLPMDESVHKLVDSNGPRGM